MSRSVQIVLSVSFHSLVAPAGNLTVDVPERVEQVDDRGQVNVLWEAGPTSVAPAGPTAASRYARKVAQGRD